MFQVANCIACHVNGVGRRSAPTWQARPQFKPLEILEHPRSSKEINEYSTWIFETQAGQVVTGMILRRPRIPQGDEVILRPRRGAQEIRDHRAQKSPVSIEGNWTNDA